MFIKQVLDRDLSHVAGGRASKRPRGAVHEVRGATGPAVRVIAVIGAGASGTLTAVHLLRRARADVRVVLIDRKTHGPGIAYGTCDPRHLLNVRAAGMSAFDDDPDDLLRWCRDRGIHADADDFLPRALFGEYLRGLLARFGDGDRLKLVTGAATRVAPVANRDGLRIELAHGRALIVDAAVLAPGNSAPAPLPGVGALGPYVPDPWAPGALARAAQARRVVIVGSGLTAVDVALSVSAARPGIQVCAISRHGWLPRVHLRQPARVAPVPPPCDGRSGLPALVNSISAAVSADPRGWREVVDGLRPSTNELWQRLSVDDRKLFMDELKPWWDVHRHRMAPAVADEVRRLQRSGVLTVHAARFDGARSSGTGVRVEVLEQAESRQLHADLLINATGPSSRLCDSADPLIRRLLDGGYARPDDLGIGFACDRDGRLLGAGGTSTSRLFTIGPPRRGELPESTAIPDIRAQARALSHALFSSVPCDRAPDRELATTVGR